MVILDATPETQIGKAEHRNSFSPTQVPETQPGNDAGLKEEKEFKNFSPKL